MGFRQRLISAAKPVRGLLLFVILPTIVAALYYQQFATPVFVSETQFTVRSQTGGSFPSTQLSGILTGVGSSIVSQDIAIVGEYLKSRDMLDLLQVELNLRSHFADPGIDWWSRLAQECSIECFLEYYRDKIEILVDSTTGIVTLKTKAFSPEMAKAMADLILVSSESLVNTLSVQIARDSLAFAENEIENAERRFKEASSQLTRYRNATNILDPAEKTGAVMGIIAGLEASLAESRTGLNELLSYMRPGSAEIVAVQSRIRALEAQIAQENQRLTGEDRVELSAILEGYERYSLEKQIAHELYTSTLASLEAVRNEASRKQLYLVTFVRPTLADESTEPDAVWNTLTVFSLLLVSYVSAGLLFTTIRDHVGF